MAVARRLVKQYGLSQSRAAALMGVRQASVSSYLSASSTPSDRVEKTAAYIASKGLEERLVKMALAGTTRPAISAALEKAATDPYLLRHVLSTKALQLLKKTTPKQV
jgi:transcriptional regulator with XRE-family HTH domain